MTSIRIYLAHFIPTQTSVTHTTTMMMLCRMAKDTKRKHNEHTMCCGWLSVDFCLLVEIFVCKISHCVVQWVAKTKPFFFKVWCLTDLVSEQNSSERKRTQQHWFRWLNNEVRLFGRMRLLILFFLSGMLNELIH